MKNTWRCPRFIMGVMLVSGLSSGPIWAAYSNDFAGGTFSLTGYIREYLSINLENKPDILANGDKLEGHRDINMARSVLLLDGSADYGRVRVKVIGRWSREVETDYLDRLNDSSSADIMDDYNENSLRELYADIDITDRVLLRLGKQQVAWGETDSFQVLDLVNGFDFNWRSSFEAENEELRKPLYMANLTVEVPSLVGTLQFLYRPGWDDEADAVHTLPFEGGRFGVQGSRGFNVLPIIPQNFDHNRGDTKDASYGGRWSGIAGQIGYTLNYYHTVSAAPVINFANFGFPGYRSFGDAPKNGFAEFIYPEIDVFGGSFNAYSEALDTVFRGELAFVPDKPYNYGFSGTPLGGALNIVEKDTAIWMLGIDKKFPGTVSLLGTSEPAFLTGQLIDTWVVNFDKDDDLLESGVTPRREHSVVTTWILGLNFRHSTVNPTVGVIYDATYGGGVGLLALTNVIGDRWRIYTEYLGFFKNGQTCGINPATGNGIDCQHGLGNFDNADQITVRLTYQF